MYRTLDLSDVSFLSKTNPWTPAELGASLALWLDADDTSTITLNGSTVSQWDDKSGNNRHATQASASAQPTYVASSINGKPGIDFYQNKGLRNASASITVGFVICVPVSENATWASYHAHFDTTSGIAFRIGGLRASGQTGFWQDPYPSAVWDNGAPKTPSRTGFDTIDSPHIIGFTPAAGRGNPMPGITIGNFDNGTTGGSGAEHETIVLSSEPSTADRQKLEGYLAWKWGLVANLPAGHPYKSTPPLVP